jgi:hypothetical protein
MDYYPKPYYYYYYYYYWVTYFLEYGIQGCEDLQ